MRERSIGVMLSVLYVALVVSGCSSSPKGPGRTAKAVESLGATKKELADANKQVAATNDSLQKLIDAGGGDLRPLYNKFADNIKKTEDAAKDARARAEGMKKNTDAYVAEWQKETGSISDEQLRKMSQERASAAKTDFDGVRSAAADTKAAYAPYMQALKDVQQYLANDLTVAGVQAIRPKATDTINKGQALQSAITNLQGSLDGLSAKWSSKMDQSK